LRLNFGAVRCCGPFGVGSATVRQPPELLAPAVVELAEWVSERVAVLDPQPVSTTATAQAANITLRRFTTPEGSRSPGISSSDRTLTAVSGKLCQVLACGVMSVADRQQLDVLRGAVSIDGILALSDGV
jgi:hypothetical protein